jgi:flagellar hook-associated protein 2
MSITFSGLATGIDTDSIITKLMEIERAPITRLEAKKTKETTRLEAYAQFKTTLDDLKSAVSAMTLTSQVKTTSTSLSAGAPFTATSASAGSGSYNIAVKQLAQVQKTVSDGWASQSDPLLGTGTFTINNGTADTNFTLDASNNSLAGLAAAINEKSGDTGVKATIINDGTATPYRLVFTGVDAVSDFTVSSNLTDGTNAIDFATTQTQTAQQSIIMVDGIEVIGNSNTISGAISGITLNLNAVSDVESAGPPPIYKSSLLTVAPDTGALKEKITTFVSSYNKAMEWILSGYEEFNATDTTTTDTTSEELLGSVLRGDASINGIKRGLQSILSSVTQTSGSLMTLSQLGITTNLNGTLSQSNTQVDAALANNFDDVGKLLSGEDGVDGIMKKFNSYLLDVTSSTIGMYASKKESYDMTVDRIDDQILNMESRMARKEAAIRAKYTAMEELVSGLNAQGTFLTQQMDMLSNMIKG